MANPLESLNISVLGAGSWGTALARLLANKGINTTIWAFEKDVANGIQKNHKNPLFLNEIDLPKNLLATNNLSECLKNSDIVISVIPSHALRTVLKEAEKNLKKDVIIVSCTKGIEPSTGKLVSEIIKEILPNIDEGNLTFLSGPSFAIEVAKDLPTTVVIAGRDPEKTQTIQELFRTDTFLTFTHNDVIGVELGGAIKNVIAISTGMSDGLGFGSNTRAATITRGLYEMVKIGKALGANPFTFTGLSGMGDLVLTCTSKTSRNYSLGYRIGQGEKLKSILSSMKMVAEGVKTTEAIHKITTKHKVNAPISEEMYNILFKDKSPREAASDLMKMELKEELRNIL